jgi:Uncharacterised nucleotidyltransferase
MGELRITPPMRATAVSLAVDLVTAEVASALRRAGVACLLLKGPTIASWLYGDGGVRPYADTDLLVPPDRVPEAEKVLASLRFSRYLDAADTLGWELGANRWQRRRDGADIDLHWTLIGVKADPQHVWERLSAKPEPFRVQTIEVDALSIPGRTMHIGLHAAQHGRDYAPSLADLDAALRQLSETLWREAAELAADLDALDAFSTGLRLRPAGRQLAELLALPPAHSFEATLLASTPPAGAMGWFYLQQASGWHRVRIAARKIVPTRRFMRQWSSLASRGGLGLVAAYLWRPVWVLLHAVPGYRAWRRARRSAD